MNHLHQSIFTLCLAVLLLTSCGRKEQPREESGGTSPAAVRGDFDANGVPDLLWENETTRESALNLYKRGPQIPVLQSAAPLSKQLGWRLASAADFDGNGVPDLVWQADKTREVVVHYYNRGAVPVQQDWKHLNQAGIPGWRVADVADFDGNGSPDLVWENDVTHQVTVHYYGGPKGSLFQTWALLNPGLKDWHMVAAADFDGNKTPDLVWQQEKTRTVTVHFYGGSKGAAVQGWSYLNAAGTRGWTVAGANDFDGNGTPDLVLVNDATRQATVHLYAGNRTPLVLRWGFLNEAGLPGWTVVVPH